ncbi:MAG: hypothetical protein IPO27_13430 [Bacteroidetes bacterium]|nr:hypothetical protein [Bacteroidota bacterium]
MTLIREFFAPQENAPVMVLFGGNPERMNEVVSMIRDSLKTATAIGNFSEEEGLKKLSTLKKVDLVLIRQIFRRTENQNQSLPEGTFSRGCNYRTWISLSL